MGRFAVSGGIWPRTLRCGVHDGRAEREVGSYVIRARWQRVEAELDIGPGQDGRRSQVGLGLVDQALGAHGVGRSALGSMHVRPDGTATFTAGSLRADFALRRGATDWLRICE